MKIYDFEECEAIAFDFRLETEMFLINEPWSIPQVGRDTTVTNLAIAIGTACQWQLIYLNISGLIRAVLPIWQICLKLSDLMDAESSRLSGDRTPPEEAAILKE
jgi:hypothetical protein